MDPRGQRTCDAWNLHVREPGDPIVALWQITSRVAQGTQSH